MERSARAVGSADAAARGAGERLGVLREDPGRGGLGSGACRVCAGGGVDN